MRNLLLSCLTAMAIALMSQGHAVAAALLIDDTSPNETITFSLNDFEHGFTLDGTVVQQGLNKPVIVTVPETDATTGAPITHLFSGRWIANHLATVGVHVVAFAEDGIDPTIGVSDILTYTYDNAGNVGTLTGSFESGSESLLTLPTGATVVFGERYVFSTAFLQAIATSDVPEPATLALLGLAFAGIGVARQRRLH